MNEITETQTVEMFAILEVTAMRLRPLLENYIKTGLPDNIRKHLWDFAINEDLQFIAALALGVGMENSINYNAALERARAAATIAKNTKAARTRTRPNEPSEAV